MDIRAVKFRVGSQWRVGGLYRPAGAAVTPAVILFHGFPGVQQNEDMAAELCRRGLTVFLPHFRGSWGSGGRWEIGGLLTDARAAVKLLSKYHGVDPWRIGLLGYSLGGWIALRLAAEVRVAAAAVLAPAFPRSDEAGDRTYIKRNGRVVSMGPLTQVWSDYLRAAQEDHPGEYLREISPTPLLFVQGLRDRLVHPASTAALFALARHPKQLFELENEDHEFQSDRAGVVAAVCGWLAARLTGPEPEADQEEAEEPASEEALEFVDLGTGD